MEVVIAVGVLLLIIGPAAGLYVMSNKRSELNRKLLIASNLAEEGVELVRAMRDSNRLRFPAKADVCWLTVPSHMFVDDCELPQHLLQAGTFTLENKPDNLELVAHPGLKKIFDQNLGIDTYTLDGQGDEAFHLKLDNSTGRYTYGAGDATPFYRELAVEFIDLDNADHDGNDTTGIDLAKISVRVLFKDGREIAKAARAVTLTR